MFPSSAIIPKSLKRIVLIRWGVGVCVRPPREPLVRGVVELEQSAVARVAPCVPAVCSVVVTVAALARHNRRRFACHCERHDVAV
jgi:hypothetical protein